MSVELDPPELHFKRPFTKEVSQILKLQNVNSEPVAFKVKTTAPKQYCVRPNSGRIEAGSFVEVHVLLQAMKEDPPPDAKCRDKFLVQTIGIGADKELSNPQALWAQVEQSNKAAIHEKKIRVQFLPADAPTPVKPINGASNAETPGASSPEAFTPVAPASAVSSFASKPAAVSRDIPDEGAKSSTLAAALPTNSEELKEQLNEARSQIAKLTSQLKEQGELRQRKVADKLEERGFTNAAQAVAHPTQAAGVPLMWVAVLCLLTFGISYFFF